MNVSFETISAIRNNELEKIREIINNPNLDERERNYLKTTILIVAVEKGNSLVTRFAIEQGADINAKDKQGKTALHVSTWTKNKEITQLLLDANADVNQQNKDGFTPLHFAAQEKNNENQNMEKLLEHNPDLSLTNYLGQTALHVLVINYDYAKNIKPIELLIQNLKDSNQLDSVINISDVNNRTALDYVQELITEAQIGTEVKQILEEATEEAASLSF